jgi:hypothetical protein
MQYMLNIALDYAAPGPQAGGPGYDEARQAWADFTAELMQSGKLISGASLAAPDTATTVTRAGGSATVVDGPFAETKEQIAGFYLINVDDLDAALEWAKRIPLPAGSIEVRPTVMMSSSDGGSRQAG